MKKNKHDLRLYDFVKEKIKKHLQMHHYHQIMAQDAADSDSSKRYFFRQVGDEPAEEITIIAPVVPSPVYQAYMIAMIDALLRDELKIECCTLRISAATQEFKLMQEALMMLSVSYAVDQTICCPPEPLDNVFSGPSIRCPLVVSDFALQNRIDLSVEALAKSEPCGQEGRATSGTAFTFSSRQLEHDYAFCTGATSAHDFSVRCDVEKLMMIVEKNKQALMLPQEPVLSIVIPTSAEQYQLAALLAQYLQHKGRCVDLLFPEKTLTDAQQQAEKMGAQYVLMLGPEEQKNSTVVIKNVVTNQLSVVKQVEAHLVVR